MSADGLRDHARLFDDDRSLIALEVAGIVPGKPLSIAARTSSTCAAGDDRSGFHLHDFCAHCRIPFYLTLTFAFVFGILLVLPIGSADMPW